MAEGLSTEEYIISESAEINMGERPGILSKFFSAFPAFSEKNYRLYFSGQFISLIGTWLQMVAQGWLVLELSGSALWVGIVAAMANLPVLFFALFGGVIVDRLPKKNIIIFAQVSSMVLAFILGIFTVFHIINVWEIAVLAFLLGTVSAIDAPARQAFVIEMVGRKKLESAIALNSGTFNGARIIGPAIAGIAITLFGTGGAFLLNALSYIAVLIALLFIKVNEIVSETHPHPIKAIKEGISYSFTDPTIRILLIFTGLLSIFAWSYSIIIPVLVKDIYHLGSESLGYFYSAAGLGSIAAVAFISSFSKKISNSLFIIGGNFLFVFSAFILTFTTALFQALPPLFLMGFGLILQSSIINTTIQHLVEHRLRGRVMSIYVLMFMGMFPFAGFQVGFFAERFGAMFPIRLGAFILFIFGIILFLNKGKIEDYKRN